MAEKAVVEKLGDHNWPLWKYKIGLILGEKGLADVVKSAAPPLPSKEWVLRDGIAQSVIGLALEDTQVCHVMGKTSAKEMWDALQQHHERKSMCGKVYLLRKLLTSRMSEGGSMADHLSQLSMLVNRLAGIGEATPDHWLVSIMLSSLPESYNMLIMSLESRPQDELSLDFVKGRLLDEWRRRCEDDPLQQPQKALTIGGGSKLKCHYCGKEGHFKRECRKFKQDQQRMEESAKKRPQETKKKPSDMQQYVNKIESDQESDEEAQVCFGVCASMADDVWYLDSGCTSHMTGDATKLEAMDSSRRESVCLADGKKVFSQGAGSRKLSVENGDGDPVSLRLKEVLYVPFLKNNLLSVSKIADEGFEVKFDRAGCRIMKEGIVVVAGVRIGNLYQLKLHEEKPLTTSAVRRDGYQHLWQRRLGHRHPEDIQKIVREELGSDLKLSDCGVSSVCTTCRTGKLTHTPFPKVSQTESNAVLDVVHFNLCDMEVATPSKNRYVMTLIDDFSGYCVIYLLQYKTQVEEKIEKFISLARIQFGKVPKIIRAAGSGEYFSEQLKNSLKGKGTILQQTAPHISQQNGEFDRKKRSLIELTRCLLAKAGLNKKYWGEAVSTANYLLNRAPDAATERIPYELWFGAKPSYKHLRIFGSPAYVKVPKERSKKLTDKSVRMIFVGYADDRDAYRFLDPSTDTVTITKDAKFSEQFSEDEGIREVVPVENLISVDRSVVPETNLPEQLENIDEDPPTTMKDEDSEYNSAESDVEGFPEAKFVRRSRRANKGQPPSRLIEEINAVQWQEEIKPKAMDSDQKNAIRIENAGDEACLMSLHTPRDRRNQGRGIRHRSSQSRSRFKSRSHSQNRGHIAHGSLRDRDRINQMDKDCDLLPLGATTINSFSMTMEFVDGQLRGLVMAD